MEGCQIFSSPSTHEMSMTLTFSRYKDHGNAILSNHAILYLPTLTFMIVEDIIRFYLI